MLGNARNISSADAVWSLTPILATEYRGEGVVSSSCRGRSSCRGLQRGSVAILLVTLLAAHRRAAPGRRTPALAQTFQAAQQAFDKAQTPDDFLRAASLYQEILDAGLVSGAVLYNQGNAFLRGGHRGRAIACYRQAQRYRPRDPWLDHNLRCALGPGYTAPKRAILGLSALLAGLG